MKLRKFQSDFVKAATNPAIDTACLSIPRGNGKSWLAAHLASRVMTPGDALWKPGTESMVVASNYHQARIIFRFARGMLGGDENKDYRFPDSLTLTQIEHKETKTKLRVVGHNAKGAMGLVDCPWVLADEPGSWNVNEGELLYDAIQTSQGKPGSPLKACYIGTIAPAMDGWWPDMVEAGSYGSTYVKLLQGDRATWSDWNTIRKANPLTAVSPEFRAKLREERDAALSDTRLKARFLSYRLNLPSGDESKMLLDVPEWELAMARPVPEREGQPIVGVDLGGGRAWSTAVAMWSNGRVEAIAVAPGIPSIEAQEKRDRVRSGLYAKLVMQGRLRVADGLRVQPPEQLWDMILEEWGAPVLVVSDRFKANDWMDAGAHPLELRKLMPSEWDADCRALRKVVKDGPLSVEKSSRDLLTVSLSKTQIASDTHGNLKMVKKPFDNSARDDVAAGLVLAAGAFVRYPGKPQEESEYQSVMA